MTEQLKVYVFGNQVMYDPRSQCFQAGPFILDDCYAIKNRIDAPMWDRIVVESFKDAMEHVQVRCMKVS